MAGWVKRVLAIIIMLAAIGVSVSGTAPAVGKTGKTEKAWQQKAGQQSVQHAGVVKQGQPDKQQMNSLLAKIKTQQAEIKKLDQESRVLQAAIKKKISDRRGGRKNLGVGDAAVLENELAKLKASKGEILAIQSDIREEIAAFRAGRREGNNPQALAALNEIIRQQSRLVALYASLNDCLNTIDKHL